MGNVAFFQVKELVRRGHSVTVFTPQRPNRLAPKPLLEENVEIMKGIDVRRINPWLKVGQGAFLPQFFWLLRKFDIIHLHYPFFGGAEVVWFSQLIKFIKIPLVLYYHMDVKEAKAGIFKYLLPLNKFVLPQILKSADKIIASSKDYVLHSQIRDYIEKHPEKFQEISFGVDQKRFCPQEKDKKLSEKYKLKENDKIILFVGALDQAHYFKGVTYLLKAFSQLVTRLRSLSRAKQGIFLAMARLLIVGDGDLRPYYEKVTQDLGIQDQVIFAGQISDKDLPKYYNLADLFVLPSINQSEAFSLVLLEAMACAKPCIASNLPGVRIVVDDKKTGFLVEPRNVEDLAEKITLLLTNQELAKTFGQTGLEKVRRIYNWQKTGKQLEDLYKELVL
jgi:glycosyltransferase involved in cell wall biosynthesis